MKLIIFKVGKILLATLITIFFIGNFNYSVRADSLSDKKAKVNDIKNQIDTQSKQLAQKQQEAKTLSNQIAIIDNQIQIAQLKIQETDQQIIVAQNEIENLSAQIEQKQNEMAEQKKVLSDSLIILYEESNKGFVDTYLATENISDVLDKTEYLGSVENKIETTMAQINNIKAELNTKKSDQENKKNDLLGMQKEQINEKNQLDDQKAGKDQLLAQTQMQEGKFQQVLNAQQVALSQAQSEMAKAEVSMQYKWTKGLSFCPASTGVGMIRPVSGSVICNFFCYASHSGTDFGGSRNEPIRAAKSGTVVTKVTGRPNTYGTSIEYGNYIKIAHNDDVYTLYGHLQTVAVDIGDHVIGGQTIIGTMGDSGNAACVHLHFEIRCGPGFSDAVNPAPYL